MSLLTRSQMTLQITFMPTFQYFLAFIHAQSLSSTSCFYLLSCTSAANLYTLIASTRTIVASIFAFMSTSHLFTADTITLRSRSTANDRRA